MSKTFQPIVFASLFTIAQVAGVLFVLAQQPTATSITDATQLTSLEGTASYGPAVDPMGHVEIEPFSYGPAVDPMGWNEDLAYSYGPAVDPMGFHQDNGYSYGPAVDPMGMSAS